MRTIYKELHYSRYFGINKAGVENDATVGVADGWCRPIENCCASVKWCNVKFIFA